MEDEPTTQSEVDRGGIGRQPPTRLRSGESLPSRYICCICKQLAKQSNRIFPHMSAYICRNCEAERQHVAVPESQIANKMHSPWTPDQVASLNDYQASNVYLPLVCQKEHELIARLDGLHCPECTGFFLQWAYPWMLDGSWKSTIS